jgi:membrane-associated phospholipid phosphatase
MSLLKKLYKIPRPISSCGDGYGFPSSHVGIATMLATLWLLENSYLFKKKKNFKKSFLIVMYTILIGASRYYLNYHTIN